MSSDSQPSTPRHLKRLSLSVSSSSSSPYNFNTNSPITPRTPLSASGGERVGSIGRNSIPMRLSLSGGASASGSGTPNSAPPNGFRRTSLNTSQGNINENGTNWNYPEENTLSSSPSTSTANSNSNSNSPTTKRPIRQSRRTSSISYSSSRDTYNSSPTTSPFVPSPRSDYNSLTSTNSNPNLSPTTSRSLLLSRDNGASRGGGALNERYSTSNGSMTPPTSATIPLKQLSEEQEENDNDNRQNEKEEMNSNFLYLSSSEMKSELSQSSIDSLGGGMRGGGMGLGNPSTITELNSDLLSFIAKKERKCLDLREELKRHEEELKGLKKKWETIVAKSVAAASAPPSAPPVTLTPTKDNTGRRIRTTNPSNNPIPRSPQHALDLSLLSSTFDSSLSSNNRLSSTSSSTVTSKDNSETGIIGYGHGDLESELVETAQAAKAWMGGVFGKVLDAVAGADGSGLDPLPSTLPERRDSALDQVTEEDEEEGEEEDEHRTPQKPKSTKSQSQSISPPSHRSSEASVSSLDDWQSSTRASTTSLASADSSSSFFGQFYSSDKTTNNNNSSSRISELTTNCDTNSIDSATTPTLTSQDSFSSPSLGLESEGSTSLNSTRSPSLDIASPLSSTRPPTTTARPRPPSTTSVEGGHNRRRSTFDMLGSAAGGGWNTLGKKWAQVSVAASGVADSFERKLTETLGPLEGSSPQFNNNSTLRGGESPNLNHNTSLPTLPAGVGAGVFSSWKTTSPQVVARREPSTPTSTNSKKGKEDWDWTSFLDGPSTLSQPPLLPKNSSASSRTPLSRSTIGGGHTSRKPSVMNLFDDLAASNNGHSPSYYSTHDSPSSSSNNDKLPPPISPTIISPASNKIQAIPAYQNSNSNSNSNNLPRSNSMNSISKTVKRSTSTPQIDVDKEIDEWGKW